MTSVIDISDCVLGECLGESALSMYTIPKHVEGITAKAATKYAQIAGTFGVSLGVFAVFFFGEVPRVRNDVLRQFPFFDQYFDRTIAPEDNPF
ncbi:hypothetical protein FE257_010055 [Aspergillus nanangensis]|uniref:Uncharacterized protein n=1 Tax=Aspergillus nanangensis TaxID=2582783 RepID=A0AAD4CWA2_ASPNN|nr:hypothetical protein FE257_010055 [Aspergillus nanangensis]